MADRETRVWMYRGGSGPDDPLESQVFPHPDDVPTDEDWRDTPAVPDDDDADAPAAKKGRRKP